LKVLQIDKKEEENYLESEEHTLNQRIEGLLLFIPTNMIFWSFTISHWEHNFKRDCLLMSSLF
jgi:hypothetical protein